jgi:hypothetical protein
MTFANGRRLPLVALLGACLIFSACARRDPLKNGKWTGQDDTFKFEIVNGTIASFSFETRPAPGFNGDSHCEIRIDELTGEIADNRFVVKGSKQFDHPKTTVGFTFEGVFDTDNTARGVLTASQSGSLCRDTSFGWRAEKDTWTAQRKVEREANSRKLVKAARDGNHEEIKRLLAQEVDVNWQTPDVVSHEQATKQSSKYYSGFASGATAITESAQRKDYEAVELLLKAHANPRLGGWLDTGGKEWILISAIEIAEAQHNQRLLELFRPYASK